VVCLAKIFRFDECVGHPARILHDGGWAIVGRTLLSADS
jgi:hypothetical protein